MRNDNARWDAPAPLSFTSTGLTLTKVTVARQCYVSAKDVRADYPEALQWRDVARGDSYVLTLRRDRVLVVGDTALATGFHPATGHAVTDVSDGYIVLDLIGPDAFATLQRGAELRLDAASRSVTRSLFGTHVHLCRRVDGFRLHAPRATAQALRMHLGQHP